MAPQNKKSNKNTKPDSKKDAPKAETNVETPVTRKIGSLACQRDGYAKGINATIVSSVSADSKPVYKKAVEEADLKGGAKAWWAVELSDTVLFPGGGEHNQQSDNGTIDGVVAALVIREGDSAIHFVAKSLEVGKVVEVIVNWVRRYDNMQQHSALHLLSAVCEGELKVAPTGWEIDTDDASPSYIELPVEELTQEQLATVEEKCNAIIGFAFPIAVWSVSGKEAKDMGISKENVVPESTVRVVTITAGKPETKEGETAKVGVVDSTTCCGTHLDHVGHIHSLKLLHFEPREDKTLRLYYVAGDRSMAMLQGTYARERKLVRLLQHRPEAIAGIVQQLLHNEQWLKNHHSTALRELQVFVGKDLAAQAKKDKAPKINYHKEDADAEFLVSIGEQVKAANSSALIIASKGDKEGGDGQIVLGSGDESRLKKAIAAAEKILSAKSVPAPKGIWRGTFENHRKSPELTALDAFEKEEL